MMAEQWDSTPNDAPPLDPVDWEQLRLLARLTPAQRTLTMIRAVEFVRAGLRGALRRRFPELSDEEVNMKVLGYLTTIRGYYR